MSNEKFVYTEEVTGEIVNIPVKLLHHHHDNPRKDLGDLSELTASIKAKGVLQNLTVVPFWFELTGVGCDYPEQQAEMGYLVVIGNRRLEAAKAAGLETLPCIIASMTHAEQVQTMLLENMQRADLTVYEQAQGFQMMMDFGDTIESISEKTGFSSTTVRRRLKMAELDKETLKKVSSERQLSLMDFDRLYEIDDMKTRNAVLAEMGTNNFENKLSQALRAQKEKKREQLWRTELEKYNAVEIPVKDKWDSKYERLPYVGMAEEPEETLKRMLVGEGPYYYCIDYGTLYLRVLKVETDEDEARKAEAERAKERERIRKEKAEDISERMFQLRVDFVRSISEATAKKYVVQITAFMVRLFWEDGIWEDFDSDLYSEIVGATIDEDADTEYELVKSETESSPYKAQLAFAYSLYGDNDGENFFRYDGKYQSNKSLTAIYEFLTSIGYELSDEEKALIDGTHELYVKDTPAVEASVEAGEIDDGEDADDEEDFDIDDDFDDEDIVAALKEKYDSEDSENE